MIFLLPLLASAVTTGPFAHNDSTALFEIQSPADLFHAFPQGVPQKPAMFGRPVYGREFAMSGRLLRPNDDNFVGCKPLTKADIPMWPSESSSTGPIILFLKRGNCTFVSKVRHAQAMGAIAAVIEDNENVTGLPLMADDATGGDIVIPSMVVSLADGTRIVRSIDSSVPVLVTLQWNLPHPDNRVEWELWTSSDDSSSIAFKQQFAKVTASLNNSALFIPHYYFDSGGLYGCTVNQETAECKSMCTNGGRYCSIQPGEDAMKGLTGAEVVRENLRQMCLWQSHKQETNGPDLWFQYVNKFQSECASPPLNWTQACSEAVMTKLRLNASAVRACVTSSGGVGVNDGVNSLIATEIKRRAESGIFFVPTVTINTVVFTGALSCRDPIQRHTCALLSALCSGFAAGTEPNTCKVTSCELGTLPDECGLCNQRNVKDACGICFVNTSMAGFNQSCAGCDGVPNSGALKDECGVCKGPGKDKCGLCLPLDNPDRIPADSSRSCDDRQGAAFQGPSGSEGGIPVYAIIVWCAVIVAVVGFAMFCIMRRREDRMRNDVDQLLRSYLPLETQTLINERNHR